MRLADARNVLKVATGASKEDIHRAYRREALRCHPDKNPGHIEAATVSFQHVQTAFVVLQGNDDESCKENIRERAKASQGNDAESCKENIRERAKASFEAAGGPNMSLRETIELAKAVLEESALNRQKAAEKEAFLAKNHWKRVPSRSRPGEFYYEHWSGLTQRAFPSFEPTARDIADWNRSQKGSLGAEKRAAAALASGRPQAVPGSVGVAPTARWPKWRWLGRRDRADEEEVR